MVGTQVYSGEGHRIIFFRFNLVGVYDMISDVELYSQFASILYQQAADLIFERGNLTTTRFVASVFIPECSLDYKIHTPYIFPRIVNEEDCCFRRPPRSFFRGF